VEPPLEPPRVSARVAGKTSRWGSQAVWTGILIFLGMGLVAQTVYGSAQDRRIGRLETDLGDAQKHIVDLNKVLLDLRARVKVIEEGPRVVPTQAITPPASLGLTEQQRAMLGPVYGMAEARKEIGDVKAAVQQQSDKLDAVLDGLRNVRGRRR